MINMKNIVSSVGRMKFSYNSLYNKELADFFYTDLSLIHLIFYFLNIFSIGFPFANSSINLSNQRIFCMSLSSIPSTRHPHILPVIFEAFVLICGACVKNVSKSLLLLICCRNVCWLYPVSQQMMASTSAFARPFFSAFLTPVQIWSANFRSEKTSLGVR